MIDDVRAALTALRARGLPKPGDLVVIELESADGAFLAVDDQGRPHLLLSLDGTAARQAPASNVATLEIGLRELVIGRERLTLLDVTCLFESLAEVFDHFIVAVLEGLGRDRRSPVGATDEVLEKWKLFLLPAGGPPGREKLAAV